MNTLWAIAKDYAMNANSDESSLLAKLTDKGQVKWAVIAMKIFY